MSSICQGCFDRKCPNIGAHPPSNEPCCQAARHQKIGHPSVFPPHKRLSLKVEYGEVGVGNAIRAAGGVWDKRQKVWKLAYKQVMALKLMDRIVSDGNDEEAG